MRRDRSLNSQVLLGRRRFHAKVIGNLITPVQACMEISEEYGDAVLGSYWAEKALLLVLIVAESPQT